MNQCLPALLLLITLIIQTGLRAQNNPASIKVISISNTADLEVSNAFYDALKTELQQDTQNTVVLVNGDFTQGAMNAVEDSLKIRALITATRDLRHVQLVFIPGDRDWANQNPGGWKYLRKLEKQVESYDHRHVHWTIGKGCPGPDVMELSPTVLLVSMQTPWWTYGHSKPTPEDATCKIATEDAFREELRDLVEENADKNIILAGHYPVLSYGPYGGKWPLGKHLGPVPLVSTFKTAFRSHVGTRKDISHHSFDPFRHGVFELLQEHQGLIYLSGHDHNLQVLRYQDHYLINSGAVASATSANQGPLALLSDARKGFIGLTFMADGNVKADVTHYNGTQLTAGPNFDLYTSSCNPQSNIPTNPRNVVCGPTEEIKANAQLTQVNTQAGAEYAASKFKQSWWGTHYRPSWVQTVSVPVLDMINTYQGLTPFQKGGGRQTTSLKLKGGDGRSYVFRSVNKDPAKALEYALRETVVATIVRDQTSTQQPYGAMAVDHLLNPLDILHAHPKLYVLPDHQQLGVFRKPYAGLLGMLEEHPRNPKKVSVAFAEADDVVKSHKLFSELFDDHDHKINQQEFVRARVFDLWIGDWGKHEDNWKWAGFEEEQGMHYRPIPRDRDHAFSLWDGILPWIADREWAKASAANFGYEFKGIRSLMWQARHLDRFLGNELDANDWQGAATFIQSRISDEYIQEAVRQMPEEIYETDGRVIAEKLKQRLSRLDDAAGQYYKLLAKEVDVVGSNKRECFEVHRGTDGSVEVTVCDLNQENPGPDSSRMYYHRKFWPHETKEIRLFGMGKADYFHIFGETDKSIPIRVIGGPGADEIIDESQVKGAKRQTLVYEQSDKAILELGKEAKVIDHWDPQVYNYQRTRFAYNTYLPYLYISANRDFGLGLKGGVRFTNQRYGKQDYSTQHTAQFAFSTENIKVLSYEAKFRHALGRWDWSVGGLVGDHYYFRYFFGIGNGTTKVDSLFDNNFYRTSYNSIQVHSALSKDFWKGNSSYFKLGVQYEHNTDQIETNTILDDAGGDILGSGDVGLLESSAEINLDFRDRTALPQSGVKLFAQNRLGWLTEEQSTYVIVSGYVENHLTARLPKPLTWALRVGGSTSSGDIPFYKLVYLGQDNNLRGFFRNRFTGESTVFLNTEVRYELTEFQTPIFPLKFGLSAFYDTGRVYSDEDTSDDWHYGYGVGCYLVPLKEEISLNISVAFSDEETGLVLLGIGKSF